MPTPSITLKHLKTSKQHNSRLQPILRYWFEWSNRTSLSALVVRLELLDADGNCVTKASIRLPKTKQVSVDEQLQKPTYDTTVWFYIDDIVRNAPPASYRFYTIKVLKRSDMATGPMDGPFDDLSNKG